MLNVALLLLRLIFVFTTGNIAPADFPPYEDLEEPDQCGTPTDEPLIG